MDKSAGRRGSNARENVWSPTLDLDYELVERAQRELLGPGMAREQASRDPERAQQGGD